MHGLVSTTIDSSQQESCRQTSKLNTRYHLLPLLSCGHPPHNMSIKRFIEGRYKNTRFLTFHGTSFNAHACVRSAIPAPGGPALMQFHTGDFLVRLFWPITALFTAAIFILHCSNTRAISHNENGFVGIVFNEVNTNCKENNFEYIMLVRVVSKLVKIRRKNLFLPLC